MRRGGRVPRRDSGSSCRGTAIPPAGANLAKLKNPDPEVRIEALRELQTSLDPRIPTAMLPLLADEGNSIRRWAALAAFFASPKNCALPGVIQAAGNNPVPSPDDLQSRTQRFNLN